MCIVSFPHAAPSSKIQEVSGDITAGCERVIEVKTLTSRKKKCINAKAWVVYEVLPRHSSGMPGAGVTPKVCPCIQESVPSRNTGVVHENNFLQPYHSKLDSQRRHREISNILLEIESIKSSILSSSCLP